MKITIVPANSPVTIQVEGTHQELTVLVSLLTQMSSTPSSASGVPATIPNKVTTNIYKAKDFVASIFSYASSTESVHGRGRYIAELLTTGNVYTYDYLLSRSKASRHTLRSTLLRMQDAGAIFTTTPTTIKLESVPDKKYVARKRRAPRPSAVTPAYTKKKKDPVAASLTGRKVN
jgi:hypothetical protein